MTRRSVHRFSDEPTFAAGMAFGIMLLGGCWSPVSFEDVPREEESTYASGGRDQVAEIGAAGGTIELENGVALTLPRNALERTESIGVRLIDEDEVPRPPGRFESVSDIVEVTPHGLKLEERARLRVPYVRPAAGDVSLEARVLRLADPDATEWETLARRDAFDLGDSMEVELREFSFYLVAFAPASGGSSGAPASGGSSGAPASGGSSGAPASGGSSGMDGEAASCDVGEMRCSGWEDIGTLPPEYEDIFGGINPERIDPSLFGGVDFNFGFDVMVCTERGWETAESCAPGGSCVDEGGDPSCECGGSGLACCLDDGDAPSVCDDGLNCVQGFCSTCGDTDQACCPDANGSLETCNEGLSCIQDVCQPCGGEDEACCLQDDGWSSFCNEERQCLEGVCKSTCECPSGDTCFTEGDEVSGFDFRCGGDSVQCDAEGRFVTRDDQGVRHLVDRVQWACGVDQECATIKRWDHFDFETLVDDAVCLESTQHICSRGTPDGDFDHFEEDVCDRYEACLVCSGVTYYDGDPPETSTWYRRPYCYSGLSTDPACSLEDPETQEVHEWRCPSGTTCSATRRGRCESTAGPFYQGDGTQDGQTCY